MVRRGTVDMGKARAGGGNGQRPMTNDKGGEAGMRKVGGAVVATGCECHSIGDTRQLGKKMGRAGVEGLGCLMGG